jgi:hypothetical protein
LNEINDEFVILNNFWINDFFFILSSDNDYKHQLSATMSCA